MADINTQFCRLLLSGARADAKKAGVQNVIKAEDAVRCMRDHWTVTLHVPGRTITWDGSADNATHAKAQAWFSWLRQYAPEEPAPDDDRQTEHVNRFMMGA